MRLTWIAYLNIVHEQSHGGALFIHAGRRVESYNHVDKLFVVKRLTGGGGTEQKLPQGENRHKSDKSANRESLDFIHYFPIVVQLTVPKPVGDV